MHDLAEDLAHLRSVRPQDIGTVPASPMDLYSGSNHHNSLVVKMIGPTICGRSKLKCE